MTKEAVQLAHNWIKQADAILVTASNGFSISEGYNLFANDKKLREAIGEDLVDKYHIPNLIMAANTKYPNEVERWRVLARIGEYYFNNYAESTYMTQLKKIIGQKPYFIWTSNTEHHFDLVGLNHTLEIEGNSLEAVCSKHPAEHGVQPLANKIHDIYEKDQNGTLTAADLPVCSKCGAPLEPNVAGDDFQINRSRLNEFQNFIKQYEDQKLLVLELGIGPNNQLIKAPSMQLVASSPKIRYITINKGQLFIPDQIKDRTIGFSASIGTAFKEILSGKDAGSKTVGPEKVKPAPQLTPEQKAQQEKAMQQFYPNYMVDQPFHGNLPMYLTIDPDHPAHLHTVAYGRSWLYQYGDSAIVHCFTQQGQYYQVKLGLNKEAGEVHGFYAEAGTFIAIESADNNGTGFSQISSDLPMNANSEILVPRLDKFIQLFPNQRDLIERLAVK